MSEDFIMGSSINCKFYQIIYCDLIKKMSTAGDVIRMV
jgi:hypothetical protein